MRNPITKLCSNDKIRIHAGHVFAITCGLILFVFRLLLMVMVGGGSGCALLFVLLLLLLLMKAVFSPGDPPAPTSAIVYQKK